MPLEDLDFQPKKVKDIPKKLKKIDATSLMKVVPDYLIPEIKPIDMYRLDPNVTGAGRFYIEYDQKKGVFVPGISITNLGGILIPKGYGFLKWIAKQGPNWEKVADTTAVFGTQYHKDCVYIMRYPEKPYDFDHLYEYEQIGVDQDDEPIYNKYNNFQMLFPPGYREEASKWIYGYTRGLMSFAQFFSDRVEKIIGIEVPIMSREWGYAATLDIICLLRWKRKVYLSIVDLKSKIFYLMSESGVDKQFYESHEFQLEGHKHLLIERYPYLIDKYAEGNPDNIKLFNWAPSAWRDEFDEEKGLSGGPSYTLKPQTENQFSIPVTIPLGRRRKPYVYTMFEHKMIEAQHKNLPKPPNASVRVKGKLDIENFDWRDNMEVLKLA